MDTTHVPMQDLIEAYDMKVSEIKDTDQDTSTVENAIKDILSKTDTLIHCDEPVIEHLKSLGFGLEGTGQIRVLSGISSLLFDLFANPVGGGVVDERTGIDVKQKLLDGFVGKNVLTTSRFGAMHAIDKVESITYMCLGETSPLGIHFTTVSSE